MRLKNAGSLVVDAVVYHIPWDLCMMVKGVSSARTKRQGVEGSMHVDGWLLEQCETKEHARTLLACSLSLLAKRRQKKHAWFMYIGDHLSEPSRKPTKQTG